VEDNEGWSFDKGVSTKAKGDTEGKVGLGLEQKEESARKRRRIININ
jgi:hypothetical protein